MTDTKIVVGVRWPLPQSTTMCGEPVAAVCTLSFPMARDAVDGPGCLLDHPTVCERCGTPLRRSPRFDAAAGNPPAGSMVPPPSWWEPPAECWEEQDPGGEIDVIVLAHDAARCRELAP